MTEAEFANLVEDIRPELVRIAGRRCGRDLAEDAVQKLLTRLWTGGRWQTDPADVVKKLLRAGAAVNGTDEFRQIARFRGAQKNLRVLAYPGGKRVAPKGGADHQAGEIQRQAQRRQEAGQ